MKIVFATGNPHKLQELREIAGSTDIEFVLPPDEFNPIENGSTFEENSLIKAREAARLSGEISLADDSGLCVEALSGAPGIHSARYDTTPQKRIDKLLNAIKNEQNRRAKFVCAMTLVNPKGEILFQTTGECKGEIAYSQKGINGFGYDPIFIPDTALSPVLRTTSPVERGKEITMAEMSEDEKNKISHRANALKKVLEYLSSTK